MTRRLLGDERGSVVAEFAVALPAVIVVLVLVAGALGSAGRHVRLQDAAADAARLAARGEEHRVAEVVAAAVSGASASTSVEGDVVCVTARAEGALGIALSASGCALAGGR